MLEFHGDTAGVMHPTHAGFHLGFFVWWGGGGRLYAQIDCVQSIKFLTSQMPILEYHSPMHKKVKPQFFC